MENVRTDYLPIAEHGIIGDLHSIALVGTDARIDWYCCPRFDSPSVFGSILDKDRGGYYRISPVDDEWVPKQLYLPGHERPHHALPHRRRRRRGAGLHADPDRDRAAPPSADPARARGARRDAVPGRGLPALQLRPRRARDDLPRERRALPLARAVARARDRHPARLPRRGRVRRVHAPPGRDGGIRARAGARDVRAALVLGGRDARGLRADRRVLATLARAVELLRPLAGDAAPLGAHAQADDVPAHGRDRGGADHEPAGAHRRRAQLGLPLHVDPRRRLLALRAAPARLHRGGRRLHGLAPRALPRAARGRHRAAADHVRDRRARRADRGDPRAPRGLPRLGSGADRQRRRRAAAARHLRRARRLGLPLQPVGRGHPSRRLGGPDPRRRLGVRELGPGRRGHLGGARRPEGLHLLAPDVLGRDRAGDPAGGAARACLRT